MSQRGCVSARSSRYTPGIRALTCDYPARAEVSRSETQFRPASWRFAAGSSPRLGPYAVVTADADPYAENPVVAGVINEYHHAG